MNMTKHKVPEAGRSPEMLRARTSLKLGRFVDFEADAEVTSAGLLSVAALVSGILLSTSVLVAAAIRESRRVSADGTPRLGASDPAD
jgi:hypothetical protein